MISRRKLLGLLSFLPLWPVSASAKTLAKTAKGAEGPYYPTSGMRKSDVDNDLVKIDQNVKQAGGEVVYLTGRVSDVSNNPLSGLRVEIWQCDMNGRYLHTGDRNRATPDSGFQGFGHTYTDRSGLYEFKTIKPVSYPGRTPHIHVKVFKDDAVLTTQFYIKDHPENKKDRLYSSLSADQRKSLDMDFKESNNRTTAVVNVVV